MLTVRDRVIAHIDSAPFMRQALAEGLINASALARQIHPQVCSDLGKEVSIDAVFMALKRHAGELEIQSKNNDPLAGIGEMILRSDLFQFTIANSERLMVTITAALTQTRPSPSTVLVFTKSMHEVTITASESLRDDIHDWLLNERITAEFSFITALSLQRLHKKASIDSLQYPLQLLSWNGIKVIDVVSTTNELMILLDDRDVDRAVAVIRSAKRTSKAKG